MVDELSVYVYGPETRSGKPRKIRSSGTAWTAIVRLSDGRARQFYAPDERTVHRKVAEWRMNNGVAGEVMRANRRRYERKPPRVVPSAARWLEEWVSSSERDSEWSPRRRADAVAMISRLSRRRDKPDRELSATNVEWEAWHTLRIDEITRAHVEALLRSMAHKPTSHENFRRLLHKALGQCAYLTENPVPRRARAKQREDEQHWEPYRALTTDEWRQLVRVCTDSVDPLASCILVTLQCGLRSEEARALRWGDFTDDARRPKINIERAIVRGLISDKRPKERGEDERTLRADVLKTRDARRPLDLPPEAAEALRGIPQREALSDTDDVEAWPPPIEHQADDLIWPALGRDPTPARRQVYRKRPLDQSRLSKALERLRREARIPKWRCTRCFWAGDDTCDYCERPVNPETAAIIREHGWGGPVKKRTDECGACRQAGPPKCKCGRLMMTLRVHDLRHSFCSMLVVAGVPQSEIRRSMGWSSARMLDRYAHSLEEMYTDARDAISAVTSDQAR